MGGGSVLELVGEGLIEDGAPCEAWSGNGLALSGIDRRGLVEAELDLGGSAGDPARRARRSAFVEGILDRFPVLGVNLPSARFHAELWAELAGRGRAMGAHDLWLAATCLAHGLALATTDLRDFGRVPGLEVEDWSG